VTGGTIWIVDAYGCDPDSLRSTSRVSAVFDAAVRELGLHPVADATWHVFPSPGGVTGLLPLAESHLACHTFPETGFATFDLYCCKPRADWPWDERLARFLGARRVVVRRATRGDGVS
jgi:S-adenosylmethionine decarboxylase